MMLLKSFNIIFRNVVKFLGFVLIVSLLLISLPIVLLYINCTEKLFAASAIFVLSHLFFEDRKKQIILSVVLILSLFSVWYIDIHTSAVNLKDGCQYLAFCVCETVVFEILVSVFNRNRYTKWLFFPLIVALFLPIIICWAYYFLQGTAVGVDVWIALLQTNVSESIEYIVDYAFNKNGAFIIVAIVVTAGIVSVIRKLSKNTLKLNFAIFRWRNKKPSEKVIVSCNVICIITVCALAINVCQRTTNGIMLSSLCGVKKYLDECKAFDVAKEKREEWLKTVKISGCKSKDQKGVYVLVIGESQNRNHMSAYGYERDTTPWLKHFKNDKHTVLFKHAYSNYVQTAHALSYALLSKNQYNNVEPSKALSIIDVANAVGYYTVWISNQAKYGVHDTQTSIIVSQAKEQLWTDSHSYDEAYGNSYDEKIIEMLQNLKKTENMLIIIHLMGNHGIYSMRYPKTFEKFGIGDRVNEYDNSILYNDYVVEHIFKKIKDIPEFKCLVYVPDHGESVKDHHGHDAGKYNSSMIQIPMYAYFSDDYITTHKQKFDCIKSHADTYFTNDLLFNFILGIMDINIKEIYEPNNDFTSSSYNGTKDRFRTMHGKRKI